ncbi:Rnase H [Vibrio phage D520]
MSVTVDRANKDAPKPVSGNDKFITVFVDGSHCPETHAWGIGAWIKSSEYPKGETFTHGGIGLKNSTEVEYKGIELVLEWLQEHAETKGKILVLQCDNISALNRLDQFRTKMKLKLEHIKLKHVKGHTSNGTNRSYVNRIVDGLAGKRMHSWRAKAKSEAYQATK